MLKELFTSVLFITAASSDASSEMVNINKLKELNDYLKTVPEIGAFSKLIKKHSAAVVLIYTVSTKAKDDNYIYNSALKPRENEFEYRYGVTSGVLLTKDGVVVTTYNATKHADRFIVSVNSEKKKNITISSQKSDDTKIMLSKDDYEAKIIEPIENLNLTFLKINSNKKDFKFLELGTDYQFIGKKWGSPNFLINGAVIIGKARGKYFVSQPNPKNNKNKFDIYSTIASRLCLRNINGAPKFVIYSPFDECGVLPENSGGALIDLNGKLLGIADFVDYGLDTATFAIPISTVRTGLSIALKTSAIGYKLSKLNKEIEVEPLSLSDKEELKKYIAKSKALEQDLVRKIVNTKAGTDVSISVDKETVDRVLKKVTIFDMIDNDEFGVRIKKIEAKSYAYQLGMRPGDILIEFNDDVILDPETFVNLVNHTLEEQNLYISSLKNAKKVEYELRH